MAPQVPNRFAGSASESYERYFVPSIALPFSGGLLDRLEGGDDPSRPRGDAQVAQAARQRAACGGLFGLGLIAWFTWTGLVLLREPAAV